MPLPASVKRACFPLIRSNKATPASFSRLCTWELTEGAPTELLQPACFIAGTNDGVVMMAQAAIDAMPHFVKDLRVHRMIPGIGHWTQQEAPDAVNSALLEFLGTLDS